MFLVNLDYKCDIDKVEEYTFAHRAWLDDKFQEGKLLFSGPKKPRTGGVLVVCLTNRQQVEELIQEDPFYQKQIADYTITEFSLLKARRELKDFIEH